MHTLLIVEDEKMIRQGIKTMVQRSKVPVDNILECSNGEMALEILKMQHVDVMFTDIRMPKMDGITLVKSMQELPHVPLTVAISGYDDFSYAVELMRMGVREYILKPLDREKIREVLEKLNAEILKGQESAIYDRHLGKQQLKYIILNKNLTPAEKELLVKMYENTYLTNSYQIVVSNETGGVLGGNDEEDFYIHLKSVEGNELFLSASENIPILLRDELVNRYVGVSAVHSGLDTLREAYEEAYLARKEAFYLGNPVCFYQKMREKKGTLHLEEGVIDQIIQQLGTDKFEDAIRQLSRILKNASLLSYPPEEMENGIRRLLDGVLTTYANILKTKKEEIGEYYTIYGYNCLSEYESEILGWLENFCNTLNSRFDDYKNKQKIQQAIEYIKENYDKDLNMAVVSNHISMNYSLFSYVFKQYAGNNFVNYLKEIRIEEAKRLLEETDMKVIDVSSRVGYENEKHFMKTFKASCGVSPTEYRKNMQFKGKV